MTRLFFRHRRDTERGQILVVVAGGMLLFLALVALVVDLGFAFMLRRQEQNAADPGAIAAARYIPTADTSAMWDAACFYAVQNGFLPTKTIGGRCDPSTNDDSVLAVNWPPAISAGPYAGDRAYVQVTITRPHRSFFAGVVGLRTFNVSNGAVAANDTGIAGAASLVSLNPTKCSAAKLNGGGGGGGGGVYIFPAAGVPSGSGGFVQVNSDCGTATGANDNCMDGPSGGLTIDGGTTVNSNTIYIVGGCNVNGSSATIGAPTDERAAYVGDPLSLLRPPKPSDLATGVCPTGTSGTATTPKTCKLNGTQTLNPGTYYGGWQITSSSTSITLNPGIYILAGGGLTQTGGSTVAAASGRVLIYGTDAPVCGAAGAPPESCQGIIDFRGSTSLNLRGLAKDQPCLPYGSVGCPYGGLLFWQDAKASGTSVDKSVDLEGSGTLYLEGTIYTAGGDVLITGNSLSTGCAPTGPTNCAAVQIVSDTWNVGGAGILNMPYDPSKFFNPQLKGLVR
jgi:Flp pilus assembly protein TadG